MTSHRGDFGSDVAFLRTYTDLRLLTDASTGAQVAVAPEYQGRVMTSTTGGQDAPSFGWLGRAAISSRTKQPHMNVFGGEDRFWLGPEGGQYSLFFKPGDPFDLEHWQVPEPLDWGAWEIVGQSTNQLRFRKHIGLANYSRALRLLDVDRTIRLLSTAEIASSLGQPLGNGVRAVGFESSNTVVNTGAAPWDHSSGLVSIWILGMFSPSPDTTIALPFVAGLETALGPIVNDKYFGKVPGDRLTVQDSAILFRGDGQYRSKIGLPASRARAAAGSYNASRHALTIVTYSRPPDALEYVNSMWEVQSEPYKGDVVNSYNDGPPAPGQPPLGPFYELESSSPALALARSEHYTHLHRTIHVIGNDAELDRIARAALNVSLGEMAGAFRPSR